MSKAAIVAIVRSTLWEFGTYPKNHLTFFNLSHDVASGSDITPCNKMDKPLVVY